MPEGGRLLVAVSGGADSTALLVGLVRIAPELGLEIEAAHLHHGLRGAEADQDLEHVRALCAHLDVRLHATRWNVRERSRRRGWSGQDGYRRLRREFLSKVAARIGAHAVATAHTADDQLETLLLRLLRGTGFPGLGGIAARRGRHIRPLLEASRHDIEADLRSARVAWREDSSNDDLGYARNRIRHRVVPALLECLGPSRGSLPAARAALAQRARQTAAESRAVHRFLTNEADAVLAELCCIQGNEIALDSLRLRSYPHAVRRVVLRRLWQRIHARPSLTHRHLEALEGLLASSRASARVELPGARRARLLDNWLVIESETPKHLRLEPGSPMNCLCGPGTHEASRTRMTRNANATRVRHD